MDDEEEEEEAQAANLRKCDYTVAVCPVLRHYDGIISTEWWLHRKGDIALAI